MSIVIGSSAGNKVTVSAPKVVVDYIPHGDRDGIRTLDLTFALSYDSGDDEIELKFE